MVKHVIFFMGGGAMLVCLHGPVAKTWCSSGLQKVAVKLCNSEFLQSSSDRSIPVFHNKERHRGGVGLFLMPVCSPNEEISLQGEWEGLYWLCHPDMCLLRQCTVAGGC